MLFDKNFDAAGVKQAGGRLVDGDEAHPAVPFGRRQSQRLLTETDVELQDGAPLSEYSLRDGDTLSVSQV